MNKEFMKWTIERLKFELKSDKTFMNLVEETKMEFEKETEIEQFRYWYSVHILGEDYNY